MTFFYDLNKRLKDVLEAPKSVHQTLNEGAVTERSTGDYSATKARAGKDIGKPGKNFEKIAKSAGERYGSKESGEKVAGAVLAKLRAKEDVEEGLGSIVQKIGGGMKKAATKAMDVVAPSDEKLLKKLQKELDMPQTGKKPQTMAFHKSNTVDDNAVVAKEEYGPLEEKAAKPDYLDLDKDGNRKESMKKAAADKKKGMAEGAEFGAYYYEKLAQKVFDDNSGLEGEKAILKAGHDIAKKELGNRANGVFRDEDFPSDFVSAYRYLQKQGVAEGVGNFAKAMDTLGGWYQERDDEGGEVFYFDDREGGYYADGVVRHNPQTGEITIDFEDKSGEYGGDISGTFNSIGDAMKALRGTFIARRGGGKSQNYDSLGGRDLAGPEHLYKTDKAGKKGTLTKSRMDQMKMSSQSHMRGGPKGVLPEQGVAEGWDDMLKDVDRRRSEVKPGHKVAGAKGDIEKTATGVRHTRRYDPKTGETDSGDETGADGQPAKRGRGRPKGSTGKIGAKGPSGTSKLMTREGEDTDVEAAMKLLKKAGYKVSKGTEELDEKAVSIAQRRAAGIAHAAQKGEIPKSELRGASKEMAKMSKGELNKFAATKEKGLPAKKSKKEQSVEETTVAGSVAPGGDAPAGKGKGGITFGKGIYDSMNREIENLIAESMNVSMNMSNDAHGGPTKSLTVTATDDDAEMLGKLLKMAGLGGSAGGSSCGCGSSPCSCESAEKVEENSPDWPTKDEVTGDNDDHMTRWAGGLNKPKTTVAGDGQTTVPVTAVQMREEDDLARMMEMAGLKSAMEADSDIMKSIKSTAGAAIGAGLGGLAGGPLGAAGGAVLGQLAHKGVEADIKANQDAAVKEDDMEEGNRFTYNLKKAREAGKEKADLDGDGDLEKVRESINSMWKAYKA